MSICYFVKVKHPTKSHRQPQPRSQTQSLHSPNLIISIFTKIQNSISIKLAYIYIFFSYPKPKVMQV